MEILEERIALSSAVQIGPVLDIFASPGTTAARTIQMQVDPINPLRLDVKDNGSLLGKFVIASISHVNAQVAGNDIIDVDNSNGFPLAPGTSTALFGGGTNNTLSVTGSRPISGSELFVAGTATVNGLLSLPGSTFHFTGVIANVLDEAPDAGGLQVQTHAGSISLTGTSKVTQTISGLASPGGGGNVLTIQGEANTDLQLRSDNATANLNATATSQGLKSFTVEQFGTSDTVNINATPTFAGIPFGGTFVDDPGSNDQVNVRANSGPVNIVGTSSTTVILGSDPTTPSKSVTAGINGLVSVNNVGLLDIDDAGNTATQEQVTVTESTVSGTGLFGPSGSVRYSGLIPGRLTPSIFTGQLANDYTVTVSKPGASFNSQGRAVLISDAAATGKLNVHVILDANSDLTLSLLNKNAAGSSLLISAPALTDFRPFIMTTPTGFEQAFVPGALHSSSIFYSGFAKAQHS
jgi:hypothetical protein